MSLQFLHPRPEFFLIGLFFIYSVSAQDAPEITPEEDPEIPVKTEPEVMEEAVETERMADAELPEADVLVPDIEAEGMADAELPEADLLVPDIETEEPEIAGDEAVIIEEDLPVLEPLSPEDMAALESAEAELLLSETEGPDGLAYLPPSGLQSDVLSEEFETAGVEIPNEVESEREFIRSPWSNPNPSSFATPPGNQSYLLGGGPSGFNNFPRSGENRRAPGGLNISGDFTASYESNVTQATGRSGDPVIDDFIMSLGGSISYLSKAREWTFGGRYAGDFEVFLDNSDFNGFNQSGAFFANYSGSKLDAGLIAEVVRERGGNRFFGVSQFVEQTRASLGLTASYEVSAKTVITANSNYSYLTASGGDFEDTRSFSAGIAAIWKYSAVTQFGPGIRFTTDSNGGNDRSSIGPTLNVNYQLSSKLSLNTRLGVDFIDFSTTGSADPSTSILLGVNWNASRLWGMDLAVYRDTEADPSLSGGFNEITAIRLGYYRKIRRATLTLGVGYEMAESVGGVAEAARPDRDYLTLDASLGMMIFRESAEAKIFARYSDQNGSGSESFDSTLIGFSLNKTF